MDQLEALDISDSNVALLFSERSFKGCYLPLEYDTDGAGLSSDQQGNMRTRVLQMIFHLYAKKNHKKNWTKTLDTIRKRKKGTSKVFQRLSLYGKKPLPEFWLWFEVD